MPLPKKSPRNGLDRALGHLKQLDRDGLQNVAGKLCSERATMTAILRGLLESVIVIDRWGTILLINPAAEKLLGIPNVEDGFPSANLWRAVPELASVLKVKGDGALTLTGALAQELELHYPALRIIRLYITPIDTDEALTHKNEAPKNRGTEVMSGSWDSQERFLIVLGDVTDARALSERQMEEARLGALTQLAAGVAHELGNPLNALQIHLQLMGRTLKNEKLSPKGKKLSEDSLNVAQKEISRLDQIIRNFLQAIRPAQMSLQPTDLVAVLEEVLTVLRAEMEEAQIAIRVELPGLLPPVMADAEGLKQIYFNLLKNAREAMDSGGTLRILAVSDDEFLRLQFIDSGRGIKEESLTHLFEPYHTTKAGGSGLGLMIAQKIMRAHNGSISLESREGVGTTVTLVFPLKYRRFKPLAAPQEPSRLN